MNEKKLKSTKKCLNGTEIRKAEKVFTVICKHKKHNN